MQSHRRSAATFSWWSTFSWRFLRRGLLMAIGLKLSERQKRIRILSQPSPTHKVFLESANQQNVCCLWLTNSWFTGTAGTITQFNIYLAVVAAHRKSSSPVNRRALKKNIYVSCIEIVVFTQREHVTPASKMHACKIEFNIRLHKVRLCLYVRKKS